MRSLSDAGDARADADDHGALHEEARRLRDQPSFKIRMLAKIEPADIVDWLLASPIEPPDPEVASPPHWWVVRFRTRRRLSFTRSSRNSKSLASAYSWILLEAVTIMKSRDCVVTDEEEVE